MRAVIIAVIVVVIGAFFYFSTQDGPAPDVTPAEPAASEPQAAVSAPSIGMIDDERINNAASEPGNWLAFGRDYEEQRFSPLTQINRDNHE